MKIESDRKRILLDIMNQKEFQNGISLPEIKVAVQCHIKFKECFENMSQKWWYETKEILKTGIQEKTFIENNDVWTFFENKNSLELQSIKNIDHKNIIIDIESYKTNEFVKKIEIQKTKSLYDIPKKSQQLPGVYIIKNSKNQFYIGESMNPIRRLEEHKGKRFQKDSEVIIFQSSEFNKSVIYDIETQLINYWFSDKPLSLLNDKLGQKNYNYFMKEDYKPVIKEIWNYLKKEKWTDNVLKALEDKHIFKYSPFKSLTPEQNNALEEMENFIANSKNTTLLLNGGAGTGKTILLVKLFVKYILNPGFKKIAFVIPNTELLKMVKGLTKIFKNKDKDIFIGKPSELSKQTGKYDLILVDESHRLNSKDNHVMPNKVSHLKNNNFKNDVDMIYSFSNHVIFAYDPSQILRPGDMTNKQFSDSLKFVQKIEIKNQMRMQESKYYLEWIDNFLKGNLIKNIKEEKYDFKICNSFSQMYNLIQEKRKHNSLVYLLSGNTRKIMEHDSDFNIEGIKINWNTKSSKLGSETWIQTNKAKQLQEVGYYDFVQGMDMNYAGVIIGRDLILNDDGELDIDINYVVNRYDKPLSKEENFISAHKEYILNRYKILLTRAIKGTYIYFEDEKLRNYFLDNSIN